MPFVTPQEIKLLLYINIMYYTALLVFFLQLCISRPRGQGPVPKPASLIHSPLYFIVSTEQWESSKMLEERQSGCCERPSLGSSLFFVVVVFHLMAYFICIFLLSHLAASSYQ